MLIQMYLTLSQTSPCFYVSAVDYKSFENTVGKEEIARNEQFLLSPSIFNTLGELFAIFINFKT